MLTSAPTNTQLWLAMASSADGTRLVAIAHLINNGAIFTSTNSGLTWISNNSPNVNLSEVPSHWANLVASSADGMKLAVVAYEGIYTSTNGGASWMLSDAPSQPEWTCVASSADGSILAAAPIGPYDNYCYYSTNSGINWTPITNLPSSFYSSIACSADGTKLCAVIGSDDPMVYSSTNSGMSWTTNSVDGQPGARVAVSADGSKLMLLTEYFYTSTNNGGTWISYPNSFSARDWPLASSADGNKLITGSSSTFYTSTNGGANWFTNDVTNTTWYSVASSADGSKLFAGSANGIYTLQVTPTPQLNIAPTNGAFALSWIIPSTNFVLQQSADLISWADLTNTPTLNLTNLQNQISLSHSNSIGFYRLVTP